MNDQKKASQAAPGIGISEAERMTKIRELLVGPVIADESARVDQSVARLKELIEEQHQTIVALEARLGELESDQRADIKRVRLGLLGIAETLLADEGDVRSRVMKNDALRQRLEIDDERA